VYITLGYYSSVLLGICSCDVNLSWVSLNLSVFLPFAATTNAEARGMGEGGKRVLPRSSRS